jgi:hypothetical protein
MSTNGWLKLLLVLWVAGYLLLACGPAIAMEGIGGTLIGAVFGLLLGSALFVPWLVGLVVLIALVWFTGNSRIDPGDRPPPR